MATIDQTIARDLKDIDGASSTSSSADMKAFSKKVKKTTVTTVETDESQQSSLDASYRPHLQARNIVIQRTGIQYGSSQSSNRNSQAMERSMSYSTVGATAGGYASLSNKGVTDVKQSRHREKKDMQDLNERLANYIEKTRFLEAQNKSIADELAKLKAKWGKETEMIKAMYEAELKEARRLLDDAVKGRSTLEVRLASIEEYLEDMKQRLDAALKDAAESRERADRNNQQLADYEGEISLLRRRLETLEHDRDKEKTALKRLTDSLTAARTDLDNETLLHIDAENRRQTLEEELAFLKAVHEQELKELQSMAYRDTTSENREFWKNEMGQALREIQQAYDEKMEGMRGELEGYYNLKVSELRTGNMRNNMESVHSKEESKRCKIQLGTLRDKLSDLENRNMQLTRELDALRREKDEKEREMENEIMELKGEVVKLRAEMDAMLKELEHIIDTKLGLEMEIAAYRRLLEGEESRSGLRDVINSLVSTSTEQEESFTIRQTESTSGDSAMKVTQVTKGQMSAQTSFTKTAKGPVGITECAPDGKFVALENNGQKDEVLSLWKLKRNVDGTDKAEYTFPDGVTMKVGDKLKVWAKGCRPAGVSNDLESNEITWGVGAHIITRLVNTAAEDRATHIQKTNYT